MAIFNFTHTVKPKKFVYHPIFYDERKERLQKMIEEAEKEASGTPRHEGENHLEQGFLRANMYKSRHKKELRGSTLKMFLAIALLLILFYVLLFWI